MSNLEKNIGQLRLGLHSTGHTNKNWETAETWEQDNCISDILNWILEKEDINRKTSKIQIKPDSV